MTSWKRTYVAVWIANLVAALGMMSFLPFFPSYLEELGVTGDAEKSVWAGVVFGAAPLAAAFMGPVWGALGDRFGRKAMVLRALVAIALFVGLMGLVRTPVELLLLRVAQGLFSGFLPPSITLVSVSAPPDRQGRIAGGLQSAMACGAIFGPLLGWGLGSLFGLRSVFLGVSVLAGLGFLLVLAVAREDASLRRVADAAGASFLATFLRDIAACFANPRLRFAFLAGFLVTGGVGATGPQLELFVRELHPGETDLDFLRQRAAWLFTLMNGVSVVLMPLWGRLGDRHGHQRLLVRASIVAAIALALHGLVASYGWLVGSRALLAVGAAGVGPLVFGVAAAESPVDRRGAAFGLAFSSRTLAISLGAMGGGFVAGVLGLRGLFLAAGAVAAAAVLLATPRRSRATEEQPSPVRS